MSSTLDLDGLFRQAVSAIDAGDVAKLERLLAAHPELARERLTAPGTWLRDKVGQALDGFFEKPYLLWFVAEDPVRNNVLPPNIAEITQAIITTARRSGEANLQEQLDYALTLVCWSWVARECGVQIALIDVLLDAGASPQVTDAALVNHHLDAAEHLLRRGARLTLGTAACLGRLDEIARLAQQADAAERQMALVLASLNGAGAGVAALLQHGADANQRSENLYAHATPLHHAVCSGSLEAVKVLVAAGASLTTKDRAEHATPLGWAEYFQSESEGARKKQFSDIADYLRAHNT